ncbi:DegT/DnrJ/EryC1/StrS family aminotransferase, partial [Xanthomonas sp. LMG 8992]
MVDVMDVPFLDLRVVNARYADELKTAAARVIDAGWYVLGQELAAFEEEFASYCGTTHAVGVGNGLDALGLILRGYRELGVLREGDEIIVPANTF